MFVHIFYVDNNCDGDTGPNTGGIGAYSPTPILIRELQPVVMESIILPTVKGMDAESYKFVLEIQNASF